MHTLLTRIKNFTQTKTTLFSNTSVNNAVFRHFATSTTKKIQIWKKYKKIKLRRAKWLNITLRNLKRRHEIKLAQRALKTKKHATMVVLPEIKRKNKEKIYVLHSRRLRRKLKKLGKGRQTIMMSEEKPFIRRFVTSRMLIANSKKPSLVSVRKAANHQFKNILLNTRSSIKRIFNLVELKNKKKTFSAFAINKTKTLQKQKIIVKTGLVIKKEKFVRHWKQLARRKKSKKRAWKKLLNKKPILRLHAKNKNVKIRKKTAKSNLQKKNKMRVLLLKTKNQKTKNKIRKLASCKKPHSVPRPLRVAKIAESRKQWVLKKMQLLGANNITGTTLKRMRRIKKRELRKGARKSVNRKRWRWFKKAVARVIRRKKPDHLKPWERGPRNPIFNVWTKNTQKWLLFKNKKMPTLLRKKTENDNVTKQRKWQVKWKRFVVKQKQKLKRKKTAQTTILRKKAQNTKWKNKRRKSIRPQYVAVKVALLTKQKERKIENLLGLRSEINTAKSISTQTPYLTPYYRVKARLQNKKNRRGVSKKERKVRETTKYRNLRAAQKLQNARRKINAKQKKQLKPFKNLAVVTRAEKRKRRIAGTKRRKRKNTPKNKLASFPNTAGVTRKRRVLSATKEKIKKNLFHQLTRQLWKNKIKNSSLTKTLKIKYKTLKTLPLKISNKKIKTKNTVKIDGVTTLITKITKVKKTKTINIRQRTPGAGRIKNTFEASLRKQYKQWASKKNRNKNIKLNTLSNSLRSKQLRHTDKILATSRLQKNNEQIVKTNKQAYLPVKARSKKHYTHDYCYSSGKFGFAKTAAKAIKRATLFQLKRKEWKINSANTGINETLLQAALYRRRATRRARDLRKLARRHKITRVKTRPFWMKRRHAQKLQRSRSGQLYPIAENTRFARADLNKWVVDDFRLGVNGSRSWTVQKQTLLGEQIAATLSTKRIEALRYMQEGLKKKKRRLEKKHNKLKAKKKIRIKRRRIHRSVREIKITFSRFRRQKKRDLKALHIWKLRKRYAAELRQRRWLKNRLRYNRTLRQLTIYSINKLLTKTAEEKEKLETTIKASIEPTIVLTPIHFKKLANQVTASVEENKKWQKHIQAVQKQKYKRLDTVSNALTSIIPNLISLFLKNKSVLTKSQTKNAVVAGYWNLRLLIQQAYRSKKLNTSEISPERLRRLKHELEVRANAKFFDKTSVKKTRYRFQTHRLNASPNLQRGAEEWIRQYLPKFYDLFLEDTEKYGHLMITPIKIFRAHPNCIAIKEWETRINPSTIEAQFKRLTKGTRGRSSSRFENMLITSKRIPTTNKNGQTVDAFALTGTTTTKWNSFFKRNYGTYTNSKSAVLKKLSTTLKTNATNDLSGAPQTLLKAYKSIKSRSIAKNKIKYISDNKLEAGGDLDIRQVRQKSPRNSEFLERLLRQKSGKHEKVLLEYKTYLKNKINTVKPVKNSRQIKQKINKKNDLLYKIRLQAAARRTPTLVQNKKITVEKTFPVINQKRLKTRRPRLMRKRYIRQIKVGVLNKIPTSRQNVLHERNANKRKSMLMEALAIVLPAQPFQVTRQLRKKAQRFGLKKRIASRLITLETKLFSRTAKKRRKQNLKTKDSRKQNKKTKKLPEVIKKYKKTGITFTAGKIEKMKNSFSTVFVEREAGRKKFSKLFKKKTLKVEAQKTKNIQKNFVKRFKPIRNHRKKISKLAIKEIAKKGISLWATRRSELWRQLTSRWMKKRRILRRWLKGIKYSFKEKTHWTFEGEHALPDELFRLSRSRLRKLEWKKTDGKFEYTDLKKQLTLRPPEKRAAPWLEGLLYSRALYSTRRLAIRRYQLPKDQKSKKWLQKAKKQLFRKPTTQLYIKRRHWARLRMYNQRLSRSLFHIRNTKVAVKRFQKLNRKKATDTGFEIFTKGHFDRVDVNLILLKFAPSVFWAREMAKSGLISINGKEVTKGSDRFTPGDQISWNRGLLKIYRKYFQSYLQKWEKYKQLANTSQQFPKNMLYQSKLGALTYMRHPKESDLSIRGRTNHILFNWFRLDSRQGR